MLPPQRPGRGVPLSKRVRLPDYPRLFPGGGGWSRTCPPDVRRLASNEWGLPLPNASEKISGSPSETRTRTCSLKDCGPALSRWGRGGRDGTRTRIFLVRSLRPPASGEGALP